MESLRYEAKSDVAALASRVESLEESMKAIGPVLAGINDSLSTLTTAQSVRDGVASAAEKSPWGRLKDKLIETLATVLAGGIITGAIWLVALFMKGN